jgi:hypothetical protein
MLLEISRKKCRQPPIIGKIGRKPAFKIRRRMISSRLYVPKSVYSH